MLVITVILNNCLFLSRQIFDKALTEVTFTELYAELCVRLSAKLPSFPDPEWEAQQAAAAADGQPQQQKRLTITFRRCGFVQKFSSLSQVLVYLAWPLQFSWRGGRLWLASTRGCQYHCCPDSGVCSSLHQQGWPATATVIRARPPNAFLCPL